LAFSLSPALDPSPVVLDEDDVVVVVVEEETSEREAQE
jgi:hypothetical protein